MSSKFSYLLLCAGLVAALLLSSCGLFSSGAKPASGQPAGGGQSAGGQAASGPAATASGPTATSGDNSGNSITSGAALPPQPDPVQYSKYFPGLYLPAETLLRENANIATIYSDLPCSTLMDMLAAGQWQETGRTLDKDGLGGLLELSSGDQKALVKFNGQACQATLDRLHPQTIKADGAVQASGSAWQYPYLCLFDGKAVGVSLMYAGPGDTRMMINFSAPLQTGTLELANPDEVSAGIGTLKGSLIEMTNQFLLNTLGADASSSDNSSSSDSSGDSPTSTPSASSLLALKPGPDFSGQVKVASTEPFSGEVTLNGLQDDSGKTETIHAGFACNQVTKFIDQPKATPTPAPLPADFPLPANMTVKSNLNGKMIVLLSSDAPDAAADAVKSAFSEAGWKVTQDARGLKPLIFLTLTKGAQTLSITVNPQKQGTGSSVLVDVH